MAWGTVAVAAGSYLANNWGSIEGGSPGGGGSVSGEEMMNPLQKSGYNYLRWLASPDPEMIKYGGGVFSNEYQALPKADIEKRVGRVGDAYKEMFNPFLSTLQQTIDKELSKSGLLTASRSAALKSHTLGQLAVQSYLPTAELQNSLEETNRNDTWNRKMQVLGMARGDNSPSQVQFQQTDKNTLGPLIAQGLQAYGSGFGGSASNAPGAV